MRKRLSLFLISFLILSGLYAQSSLTPDQVLDRTVRELEVGKGLEARFNITNSGYTSKGEIITSGHMFRVKLQDINIWYNGKDLYTYNEGTEETTVVTPTREELLESNPLAYVTSAKNNYNVIFSTVKKSGSYVLELTPKSKRSEIKRITVTIGNSNYLPERIVVEPKSGTPVRADITSFKKISSVSPAEFEYPKKKYPKTEIIDLR